MAALGRKAMISLSLANKSELIWAQEMVKRHHYLRTPVDSRCSVEAYLINLQIDGEKYSRVVGCLIFGRPEATKCGDWYGSVEDVAKERCQHTRWEVLNLARVWLDPQVQKGGVLCSPDHLPGFVDRHGDWRPTLASHALRLAAQTIGYEYLLRCSPCFLEEPYQIRYLLSYCDTRLHRGTIYKMAGWQFYRTNERGLQTWRVALPPLTPERGMEVRKRSKDSPRSRRYRARRAAQEKVHQMSMFEELLDA
jgi:hypothetical protein